MFHIERDDMRALIRVTMCGFMDVAEVQAFAREEQQAARAMGCGDRGFLLLVNTEGTVIQSQEVVAAFREVVGHTPLKARRIAVVRGGSLTRMQTQRILAGREEAAIFSTLAEAEAWLFAPEDGRAAERPHAARAA